jgi:hypothetical protein
VLAPKVKNLLERELLWVISRATLETPVERWRQEKGRRPLATILRRAFRLVATLG